MKGDEKLYWVGYWASEREPALPSPEVVEWHPDLRELVVDFLKAGEVRHRWRGFSTCRICGASNGTTCLTDGVFMWPEGLAHYVEEHDVGIPREFLNHIMGNDRGLRDLTPGKPVTGAVEGFVADEVRKHVASKLREDIDARFIEDLSE